MTLHIFVEGKDETLFFQNFIERCFSKYDTFQYFEYIEMPDEKVYEALKTVIEQKNDFIFLGDFDFRDENRLNLDDKKKEIIKKWRLHSNKKNIHIVLNEIESWYLAGFDNKFCKGNSQINRTKIKNCIDTQIITKEFFKHASTKSHRQLITYLTGKRKQQHYNYAEAIKRNKSFERFFSDLKLSC